MLFEPWRFDALASAAAAGCIMVGWMMVEIAMLGLGTWVQAASFVVGLVMMGLAGLLQRTESRQIAQETAVSGRHHAAGGLHGSLSATQALYKHVHDRCRPTPGGRDRADATPPDLIAGGDLCTAHDNWVSALLGRQWGAMSAT